MSDEELERLEGLAGKGTPGPWAWDKAILALAAEVRLLRRLIADMQEDGYTKAMHAEALRQIVGMITTPTRDSAFEKLRQVLALALEALGEPIPCRFCDGKGRRERAYDALEMECGHCAGTGRQR